MPLDDGFHWDVTTSRSPVIASANTIWNVPSKGYLNIYPNGHIRHGKQSRSTWSRKDSAKADAANE